MFHQIQTALSAVDQGLSLATDFLATALKCALVARNVRLILSIAVIQVARQQAARPATTLSGAAIRMTRIMATGSVRNIVRRFVLFTLGWWLYN